jgi:hypothetical protein
MGMGLSYYERVGKRRVFGSAETSDTGHGHCGGSFGDRDLPHSLFYKNSKFYVHFGTHATGVREFALFWQSQVLRILWYS